VPYILYASTGYFALIKTYTYYRDIAKEVVGAVRKLVRKNCKSETTLLWNPEASDLLPKE